MGATLANLLARAGLRVAVVEAEREIYDKPRAITMDHEVMRVFQACGLADKIAPFTAPHPGTHYLGVDGRVIKKFDPLPPPAPLGWPPTGTFVQPKVEAALRAGVAKDRKADIFLGEPATAFAEDDDGVTLTLAGGRRLGGRYLLGCDGANSFVRKQLGVPLEDLAFDEWWMVVDVRLREPVELPPRCIQYCWPERPATFILGAGDLRRWEIKMLPGETPGRIRPTRERQAPARALRRSGARRHLALGGLSLPRAARHAMAPGPRLPARRFVPSDAALSGPGHVRRHPRRGEPRLEARDGAAGRRGGQPARHL